MDTNEYTLYVSKFKSFKMGLQIPRGVYPEEKKKSIVPKQEKRNSPNIPRAGQTEGM